jgi:hypothetical protein
MIIILLTLFVIALSITFAGLLLSPKSQAPTERKMSYAARGPSREMAREGEFRGGSRVYRASEREYAKRNVTMRKYVMEFEPVRPKQIRQVKRMKVEEEEWLNLEAVSWIQQLFAPRSDKPVSWLGICMILAALFGIGMVTLGPLFSRSGVIATFSWSQPFAPAPTPVPAKTSPSLQDLMVGTTGASKALLRVYQLDPGQYGSSQDYDTWAPSACSAAAMTEVINSYGHNYRIADILKVEAGLGQITPELGLLRPTGIDATVEKFGFTAVHLNKPSPDDIIKVANTGKPVIVSFPPERWTGGHILVLRGGHDNSVYLADSSQFNMTIVSRATFLKYWGGFAVVVIPNA